VRLTLAATSPLLTCHPRQFLLLGQFIRKSSSRCKLWPMTVRGRFGPDWSGWTVDMLGPHSPWFVCGAVVFARVVTWPLRRHRSRAGIVADCGRRATAAAMFRSVTVPSSKPWSQTVPLAASPTSCQSGPSPDIRICRDAFVLLRGDQLLVVV
jgi:hypothetical protein